MIYLNLLQRIRESGFVEGIWSFDGVREELDFLLHRDRYRAGRSGKIERNSKKKRGGRTGGG